ncbi:NlpC/P60 family N-terminal domain-containing protein [Desulfonatronum thioautotrophicum]|uniref:C40 family peptidase n=1 Tax=Desulfonatronum thioautotrophicum TaxID=617001 RepID=UPI000699D8D8|nr:SH3 domain-containing C40 family peptidase [Desulfonatronum thioautotrophicum]
MTTPLFVRICCCLAVALMVSACAPKLPPPGEVLDLRLLPQNAARYVPMPEDNQPLISPMQQEQLAQTFRTRYFAPWDDREVSSDDGPDLFWGLRRYRDRIVFGENLLPVPEGWLEEMTRRTAPDSFPALVHPAVTVTPTSLRVLPSHKPVFNNPAAPGQGFPFDMLQNSLIPAGTPVRVVHASPDGDWYLAMAPHVSGWVRPWEVAWVDQPVMEAMRDADLVAVTRDGEVLRTAQGMYALHGRVGMLLPLCPLPAPAGTIAVQAPQRRADGWAELKCGFIADSAIESWPLPATWGRYVRVLDGLLGQPYGWGGMYENRDCSALIQDVQALFGIALPRNSRAQALAGRVVDLAGLDAAQKEQRILELGVPLLTIVNMPGHVLLYLGPDPVSGRPVMLHALWGLRIQEPRAWRAQHATPGRWVLGRTVITTLTPGAELPGLLRPEGMLVERVTSMTILVDP